MSALRIAFIGLRGVPATVGGVEHHVEELGSRLAARGHHVTVYCRTNYVTDRQAEYRGMRLAYVPTLGTKHLDAIVHSGLSTMAALPRRPDVVHYHAIGPGLVAPLPRYLTRAAVVLTVHGLDDARDKWGRGARTVLRSAGWMSARVPNATIAVSRALTDHYRDRHGRAAHHIPNGVRPPHPRAADDITRRWGLTSGGYLLFLGRLVPEKAPDLLLRAFRAMDTDLRLVIAGSSGFTDAFVDQLHAAGGDDPRVVFTGAVHGTTVDELYSNARAFVLPSRLEGLPLTLLEAASHGTPVVASDIPPHVEVLVSSAPGRRLFAHDDLDSLRQQLLATIRGGAAEREGAAQLAIEVRRRFDWDRATDATEAVYEQALSGTRRGRRVLAPGVHGDQRPAA